MWLSTTGALAIDGGAPVRPTVLPYGRQWIDEDDIRAVTDVLRSDWVTTGPKVGEFEEAFAAWVGAEDAVTFTSGTAALHAAAFATGIEPGDEVVTTPMTFAATANCVLYQGGRPVFADVHAETLNIDPEKVASRITPRTKALVPVDFAGQPCALAALREIAGRRGLLVIEDACHALGAEDGGRRIGGISDLTVFSLHPVKHITTGEGGVVTTNDGALADRLRRFRNHGITADFKERERIGSWFYEVTDLGFNYRLTDIQCALGLSQLRKLPGWLVRRREIAAQYDAAFAGLEAVRPLEVRPGVSHAYHLYVVRLDLDRLRVDRARIFAALRAEGIGVNVHYIPVHLHPLYRARLGTGPGLCPVAEQAYEQILSLPIFSRMSDGDVRDVVHAVEKVVGAYAA